MKTTTTKKLHHSLRNIVYRQNGIFNVEKLKQELQKDDPFNDEGELAKTLEPSITTLIWATFFILSSSVLFLWFTLSFVLKISIGVSGSSTPDALLTWIWDPISNVLRLIASDWYYFIALPISLPIFMWLVYFNWLYMNFFKHN